MSSQPGAAATSPDPALPSYDSLFEDPSGPDLTARSSPAVTPAPVASPPTASAPVAAEATIMSEAPAKSATPAAPSPWDPPVAPAAGGRAGRPVDTGRLYHSAGADGPATSEAIPALPLRRDPVAPTAAAIPVAGISVHTVQEPVSEASASTEAATSAPAGRPVSAFSGRGLTYFGVVAVVAGPTLLAGLIEAAITHQIGWLTGLVLVLTSAYAALTVRRMDFAAAVVVPSLAFLGTTLVAGQLALESDGSRLVREGYMIFRTLAVNAPWIIAATAIPAVIVLVRRRKESPRPAA